MIELLSADTVKSLIVPEILFNPTLISELESAYTLISALSNATSKSLLNPRSTLPLLVANTFSELLIAMSPDVILISGPVELSADTVKLSTVP